MPALSFVRWFSFGILEIVHIKAVGLVVGVVTTDADDKLGECVACRVNDLANDVLADYHLAFVEEGANCIEDFVLCHDGLFKSGDGLRAGPR